MPLPVGVSTFTLRSRPRWDAKGNLAFVGMVGALRPSRELRIPDSGKVVEVPVTVTVDPDGTITAGPIPHTDQFGGFTYSLRWPVVPGAPSPGDLLRFAVPATAGGTVFVEDVVESAVVPGVIVPIAVGPQGPAGPVGPQGVADDTSVAALVPGPSQTATALRAAYQRVFTPQAFGAKADGVTNDTVAVQAAIDAANAAGAGTVYFPEGVYLVDGLKGRTGVTMRGTGKGSILRHTATGTNFILQVNPGSADASPDPATNARELRFADLRFEGRTDGMFESYALLDLHAVTDVRVEQCTFYGWKGDAIYIGSSRTGGVERHNRRVWITDNVFDGFNNQNRNAISVIDGDGVWIERNLFQNIAVASQPGAVCVEPNSATFSIVRNIWVRGNAFKNITGGVGVVTIALRPQAGLTVPAQGFWVVDNTFDGATGITQIRANVTDTTLTAVDADDTIAPHTLTVRGNKIFGGGRAFQFFGIRGVEVADNYFEGTGDAAIVGNLPLGRVVDMTIRDNVFRQNSKLTTSGGVVISANKATRLAIRDNDFDDNGRTDGTLGVALTLATNGATDSVAMRRNTIRGSRTTHSVTISAGHVTNAYNNEFTDNRDATPNGATAAFGSSWAGRGDPRTVDYDSNMTTATIGGVNDARLYRVKGEGLISRIGLSVAIQSGNICIGVYRHNGQPGKLNRPTDLVATSGAVACPAVGSYAEIAFTGGAVYVRDGDYFAISCDNTTATFAAANVGTTSQSALWDGQSYTMPTAFPLPAAAAGLLPQNHRILSLRGAR